MREKSDERCDDHERWMDDGWTMDGRWMDDGWTTGGQWMDNGWTLMRDDSELNWHNDSVQGMGALGILKTKFLPLFILSNCTNAP
jgi:hypothetical protein